MAFVDRTLKRLTRKELTDEQRVVNGIHAVNNYLTMRGIAFLQIADIIEKIQPNLLRLFKEEKLEGMSRRKELEMKLVKKIWGLLGTAEFFCRLMKNFGVGDPKAHKEREVRECIREAMEKIIQLKQLKSKYY